MLHRYKAAFGLLGFVAAVVVAVTLVFATSGDTPAHAFTTVGAGGTISLGTPVFNAGSPATITIPVNTTATTDPYSGINVHLTFDGTLLGTPETFVSGGALETANPVNGIGCVQSVADSGNGIIGTCNIQGIEDTTSAGTMANVTLTVKASGCSPIHLFTYNPPGPDNGNSSTGTYTTDSASSQPQLVSYGTLDVTGIDTSNGAACTPAVATPTSAAATNTPGPAPTNTVAPSATSTSAVTGTATPIGGLRTVTPSPTVGTPSAATPSPVAGGGTAVPTTAGGGTGPGTTGPGGGPGGVISGPNTGDGAAMSSSSVRNTILFASIAAMLFVFGSGAVVAWYRRSRHAGRS